MTAKLAELDAEHAKALGGGGASTSSAITGAASSPRVSASSHSSTPTRRFFELSPLAAYGTDLAVGASVVVGIGAVSGVECMLVANDPTVKGGTSNP